MKDEILDFICMKVFFIIEHEAVIKVGKGFCLGTICLTDGDRVKMVIEAVGQNAHLIASFFQTSGQNDFFPIKEGAFVQTLYFFKSLSGDTEEGAFHNPCFLYIFRRGKELFSDSSFV